jgi:hypothetical protein
VIRGRIEIGKCNDTSTVAFRITGKWKRNRKETKEPGVVSLSNGRRDVFIYMIAGASECAPAAAMALIERLK